MAGKIYGIGVGVGNPEDMTLKAVRRIRESDVLVCPREELGACRAYQIAKQAIPEVERIAVLPLEFQMTTDEVRRALNHRRAYDVIKELVLQGKTVAFLTVGDPSLYSTFSYVCDFAREDGFEVECVSGVTSAMACANRLGIALCSGNEQLHIIPSIGDIEGALDLPGTKVLLKCGKKMLRIKELLRQREGIAVTAVCGCGTLAERCYHSLEELPDEGEYMFTVIIKDRGDEQVA